MWQIIVTVSIIVMGSSAPPRSFEITNNYKFPEEPACTKYMLSEDFRLTLPPLVQELEQQMKGHPGRLTMEFSCKQEGEGVP